MRSKNIERYLNVKRRTESAIFSIHRASLDRSVRCSNEGRNGRESFRGIRFQRGENPQEKYHRCHVVVEKRKKKKKKLKRKKK